MGRTYAALPYDYIDEMSALTDEEFGRLCRALLLYSRDGTAIAPEGNERYYAVRVASQEDRFKESYEALANTRSEAGRQGAAKRWDGKNGKAIANDSKNSKAIFANGKNGNTETKTNTETNIQLSNDSKVYARSPDDFDKFWAAYPKKVGKQSARKAFDKVKVPVKTLVTAVERQKCSSQWSTDGGQYIPHPTTWLNQGRWEDEADPVIQTNSSDSNAQPTDGVEDIARMRRMLDRMKEM